MSPARRPASASAFERSRASGASRTFASIMTSPTWRTPSTIPSRPEVLDGGVAGAEEERGEGVDQDPVQLLGHRAVERAKPGLDVRDRDAELRRRERRLRASSSCPRRRGRRRALARGWPARCRAASAPSARRASPSRPRAGRRADRARARRRRSARARGRSAGRVQDDLVDPCSEVRATGEPT